MYEYQLVEPLPFKVGDIFGMSQNVGGGKVYWEDSRRLSIYEKNNENDIEVQVTSEQSEDYPLITAVTGKIVVTNACA